jgi:hypothetical protein
MSSGLGGRAWSGEWSGSVGGLCGQCMSGGLGGRAWSGGSVGRGVGGSVGRGVGGGVSTPGRVLGRQISGFCGK